MNESRFIELLNLYVDQQLSAAEAAELEAEIKNNPARRRTYQQYCRMQKACAQLFELERSSAPASAQLKHELAEAGYTLAAFSSPTTKRAYWIGGFSLAATAACAAFVVFFSRTDVNVPAKTPETATVSHAQTAAPTAVAPVVAVSAPVLPVREAQAFTSVFIKPSARDAAAERVSFVSMTIDPAAYELDWTRQIKLEPVRKVSGEEALLDQRTSGEALFTAGLRAANAADEKDTEQAAFQFQK
jgi:anti-sigma factor RsiW